MAPDADKERQQSLEAFSIPDVCVPAVDASVEPSDAVAPTLPEEEESLECVLQPQVLKDFSYMEPLTCFLEYQGKHLACNGKSACFMSQDDDMGSAVQNQFSLLFQTDGSVILQSTRTRQFICAGPNGSVYASHTRCNDMEKWALTKAIGSKGDEGYRISTFVDRRILTCQGKVLRAVETDEDMTMLWNIDMTSGELCFLSLASMELRVRCDILGTLSLNKNYQGWETWRFSEAGDGRVRISSWAHSEKLLSSTEEGEVRMTEDRGENEEWTIEKAPKGYHGVIVKSARYGHILCYDNDEDRFHTLPSTLSLSDEKCVWELESVHRQIYHLSAIDTDRKLEASRKGLVTRGLPIRILSEQWKIVPVNDDDTGVVLFFSVAREQYLSSTESGQVSLCSEIPSDGSANWVIGERESGYSIVSVNTGQVLVAPENEPIVTVAPGTMVRGSTRWKLEPKIPRQVNKAKVQAVGTAVAIGVAGTVATPLLIGGAIGALGVAHVGLAGEIAIGSIRAAEALNTITQLTLSSSQLMLSDSSSSCHSLDKSDRDSKNEAIRNRPFCRWHSW